MSTCMWKSQQLHDGSSSDRIQSLSFGPPADHIRQIYSLAPSCWALPKSCYCQRHFRAQIVVWPHSDHKQEAREQHKESFQAQRSHTQTNRHESALSTFSLCWDWLVMLLNIEQRNVLSCAINILIRFNRLWRSLFPRKPEIMIFCKCFKCICKVNCCLLGFTQTAPSMPVNAFKPLFAKRLSVQRYNDVTLCCIYHRRQNS